MPMKLKLILVSIILLALPFITSAQVSSNFWKYIGNVLSPNVVNMQSLRIPYLGSAGNPCVTVDSDGDFATSTCGTGGGSSFGQAWELIAGFLQPTTTTPVKMGNASTTNLSTSATASSSALRASNSATFEFLGTGLAKITSGALGLATAGVDYIASETDPVWSSEKASYLLTSAFGTQFFNFFSATNTDALSEGSNNKYYTDARTADYINASSTLQTIFSKAVDAFSWGNHALAGYLTAAITSLGGQTGASQTLSKTDDTNVTLAITSNADDHNFALGWTGQLAESRGGTGVDALSKVSTLTGLTTIGSTTATTTAEGNLRVKGNLQVDGVFFAPISLTTSGPLVVNGEVQAPYFTATSTTQASTFPYASTTAITVAGNAYFPSGIWNSSGNVGIGTTTPQTLLSLQSYNKTDANNVLTGAGLSVTDNNGTFGLFARNRGNSAGISGLTYVTQLFGGTAGNGLEVYTPNATNLTLGTAAFPRLTVLGSGAGAGSVGIATTSPYRDFALDGNAVFVNTGATDPSAPLAIIGRYRGSGVTDNELLMTARSEQSTYYTSIKTDYSFAHPNAIYGYNGAEIIGVYSGHTYLGAGNVGIGTAAPLAKLNVNGWAEIGNAAPYAYTDRIFSTRNQWTNLTSGTYYGILENDSNYPAANTAVNLYGVTGTIRNRWYNTFTQSGDTIGVYGNPLVHLDSTTNNQTVTVTGKIVGVAGRPYLQPAAGDTINSSDVRSFHALEPYVTGGGTGSMTNVYGLYVDDLDVGTNNYAVYTTGTTKSYFGGNVGIGTTSPYAKVSASSTNMVTAAFDRRSTGSILDILASGVSKFLVTDATSTVSNVFKVTGCPSGFTYMKLGCMQTAEEGSDTLEAAVDDCIDTYGGRLPTMGEIYAGFSNYTFTDETDDEEWIQPDNTAVVVGTALYATAAFNGGLSLNSTNETAYNQSRAYRCFVPFGASN